MPLLRSMTHWRPLTHLRLPPPPSQTPLHHRHISTRRRPTLRAALKSTKIEWYHIPVGLGIAVVAITHLRSRSRSNGSGSSSAQDVPVKPMGPWQVTVLSTLPLKALSRCWGRANEVPLPRALRVPGFKLYAWLFGVNLAEVEKEDLREYRNLAEFFYRRLKGGARVVDARAGAVVSPADGRVLQFGEVHDGRVGGVKGMEYSLDALLGGKSGGDGGAKRSVVRYSAGGADADADKVPAHVTDEEEFANVNGIAYTLPDLLSGDRRGGGGGEATDASTAPAAESSISSVSADLGIGIITAIAPWSPSAPTKRLFFAVVYLAPGDYHRFHSPVNWVVERRRHFAGELYSVSPYLQSRLPGLFTLNERVVLLGRWRHGMFSMTPVGATNVGSIRVHFDRELRTNSLTSDPTGAEEGGFREATYSGSSALLGGHPVVKGAEMGGFNLGSTVVLVFEAPAGGEGEEIRKGGFRFLVRRGQTVKVGEALGIVE